jgi:N-acetylglucosamine-6-phosphate deacetylase
MVRMAGVSLGQAWEMAARNPARLLGFEIGRLARGGPADLTVFDVDGATSRITIRAVVAGGEFRYGPT